MDVALQIPTSEQPPFLLPRTPDSPWTEERVEILRRLAIEGYSSSQVADELGLSRNAVIGKAYRLGIPLSGKKSGMSAEQRKQRHAFLMRGYRQNKGKPGSAQSSAAPVKPKRLLKLKPHDCRFVIGDPVDGLFCAARVVPGLSWCEAHARVVFVLEPARRR